MHGSSLILSTTLKEYAEAHHGGRKKADPIVTIPGFARYLGDLITTNTSHFDLEKK